MVGPHSSPAPSPAPNGEVIWRPSPEEMQKTRLYAFLHKHGLADYGTLLHRAAADLAWFWGSVVQELPWEWYQPYDQVVDLSEGVAWPHWWVGAKCNLVHNAIDRHVHSDRRTDVAIIGESEDGQVREYTFAQLHREINRLAAALHELGIRKGDRVGLYLPMIPEAAIALLTCAKIGAIAIPLFSGFGPEAIAARLVDGGARVLLTVDGFHRRGAVVPAKAAADQAVSAVPSLEHVVVLRWAGIDVPWHAERDRWWHELVDGRPDEWPTEAMEPEDPFLLVHTSGTTGKPKGVVHVHGGFPIKCSSDLAFCFDMRPADRLFWLSDMGWVMGPLKVIGGLVLGASVLMYEGSPDFPHPDRLWHLVERHRVSVLGISPTAIRSLMVHGTDWVERHDLSSLRVLGSSGEMWDEGSYRWFFQHIGGTRCPIINYAGGTEVGGGILCGNPLTPAKPGSFAGPAPGMVAGVFSDGGESVVGSVGELVVRAPWPGMTLGFWNDPARYMDTYWRRWPGVWVHGDWAEIDSDGFWFIRGRSDDTIKVAGKRIGPAEIESAVLCHPLVAEAAAIGVPDPVKGQSIVCFAVLRDGTGTRTDLALQIRDQVGIRLGKALRPETVEFVHDLPKTRSGKVMRRVLRAWYLGLDPGDLSSLSNPESASAFSRPR